MNKTLIRQKGIAARNSLSPEKRSEFSEEICRKIITSTDFKHAKAIMLYSSIRSEVCLDSLEKYIEAENLFSAKRLCYPHCISNSEMLALAPNDTSAWTKGLFGIPEPDPDFSSIITPSDIELVICPCTAFDTQCNRLGMGAGYYDRFLPQCINATIIAVAFECQKSDYLPVQPHDIPVDSIITEQNIYNSHDTVIV